MVYPLGPKNRALADETFDQLHAQGKMSYATNFCPTAYPVFVAYRMVNGQPKGRVVVDIRGLNKLTIKDYYPIPTLDHITNMVQGKPYIFVLDVSKFFYQWRIIPAHHDRMAVVTHRGQEMFHVAIMGFCNSVPLRSASDGPNPEGVSVVQGLS